MTTAAAREVELLRLAVFEPQRQWTGRYVISYGGAGSGKSRETATGLIDRCLQQPGRRILALRKVGRTVRGSVYQQFIDVLRDVGWLSHVQHSHSTLRITFPNGSEIICSGLDDPEKIKSISGVTDIWLEEASEFTYKDFTQLDLRLRGKEAVGGRITLTLNPISKHLWIKKHFVDKSIPGALVIHSTFRDNPLAGDAYEQVLSEITDPLLRQIYLEGEWGDDVEGLVHKAWVSIPIMVDRGAHAFGLDFGYNDPMTLVEVRVDDSTDLFLHQWYYETGKTVQDLIKWMDAHPRNDVLRSTIIVADSQRPDSIKELRTAGYKIIGANKAQGSVNHGISVVNSLNMHVTEDSVDGQTELYLYKWKQDPKTEEYMDVVVDANNHFCDAVRYAVDHLVKPRQRGGAVSKTRTRGVRSHPLARVR